MGRFKITSVRQLLQGAACMCSSLKGTLARENQQSVMRLESPNAFLNLSLLQIVRHVRVNGSEVKVGNIIERRGKMHQVIKTQHTQQGRGGATIQVELRDVHSGLKSSERLRTSESIERVFVDEKRFTFLYSDGDNVVLMEPSTFEQVNVPASLFGESKVYLADGMPVTVQLFNDEPLSAAVPARVTCTVADAEPYFKGQSVTSTYKKVTLDNGQLVQVPGFVEKGDLIIVETSDHSYITRAKNG